MIEKVGFALELIGVASAAISGTMVAIEKKCDAFGVVFLAIITALGGGVLRDTMIGHLPPRMFTSYAYIGTATVFSLAVFLTALRHHERYHANKEKLDHINNWFDAVGLAAFTVAGVDLTIAAVGMAAPLTPILLGLVTGIGGGSIKVPLMNIYMHLPIKVATATSNYMIGITAFSGAVIYFLMGDVILDVAGAVAIGAYAGARIGTKISSRINAKALKRYMTVVYFFIAAIMLCQAGGLI